MNQTQKSTIETDLNFLENYTDLKPVEGDENRLLFIQKGVNWNHYNSMVIDHPFVLMDDVVEVQRMSEMKEEGFKASLRSDIHENFSKNFQVIEQSGPKTLRLRVVLRALKVSALNSYSAILESEVVDSVSGERLMAAVDLNFAHDFGSWEDFDAIFALWSNSLRSRFEP
ncbi:MAG: DUF3313 domain-containing protein [Lentisphaeraceae bacterium]|nr:DUF3313 domain-containing protein [Lentisphaeraceae bacterium]